MRLLLLIVSVGLFSPVVGAHGLHVNESGFVAGLLHPLGGFDHLLAAVGMGLWLSLQRFTGLSALLNIAALVFGVAIAILAQGMITDVEWTLAASLIIVGLFLFKVLKLPREWTAVLVTAIFACHFYTHINEISAGLEIFHYVSGFVLSTVLLLAVAAMAGFAASRNLSLLWFRFAGAVLTVTGTITFALA